MNSTRAAQKTAKEQPSQPLKTICLGILIDTRMAFVISQIIADCSGLNHFQTRNRHLTLVIF
jgi:hypothetical protein